MALDPTSLAALAAFAFAASWTPGPNNVMLAASGATFGWRATQPHAFGVTLGFPVMLFLIALGLGETFQRAPLLQRGLALAGCAVMLWLAWRIAASGAAEARRPARPLRFFEAWAFQWINPKAWVMCIGVAATFASGAAPVGEALAAALVFCLSGLTSTQGWTAFGAAIRRWLGEGPLLRAFNIAMAALLAASAIWLGV